MKKVKNTLLLITLLTCFFAGCSTNTQSLVAEQDNKPNYEQSISQAGEYLQSQIQASGQFIYRVHMNPNQKLQRKYNILRHMGTLYALKMLDNYRPGSVDNAKMKQSITYMLEQALAPVEGTMLGMWSSEEIVGTKGMKRQIKLGAIGLTLVTLCQNYDLIKDEYPLESLEKLGDFALFMQKENGGFYSKYYEKEGFDRRWNSLYYPGEMAFGFVELFNLTGKQKYMDGAVNAMLYLYNERKDKPATKIEADHWALIATDKIFAYSPDLDSEIRAKLLAHGKQVVEKILSDRVIDHPVSELNGSFNADGRPTPTSTRVEGLVAIYPHIDDAALKAITYQAIVDASAFLLNAQISTGKYAGAWPRAIIKLEEESRRALKHNRRAEEIRIDYVQHALSALIGADHLVKP